MLLWFVVQSGILAAMIGIWFKAADGTEMVGLGGVIAGGLFLGWAVTFLISLVRDILMGLLRTCADVKPHWIPGPILRILARGQQPQTLNGGHYRIGTAPGALDHP